MTNFLSFDDVPRFSRFVARTLAAAGLGSEGEARSGKLSSWAQTEWTREAMAAALEGLDDSSALASKLRRLRSEIVAGLVVRNTTGRCGYEEVVRVMSDFAEEAVTRTVRVHARELAARHGVPFGLSGEPQDFIVVGMGKLGGRELNVSSDIDLIFLYGEDGETRATEAFPRARRTLTVQEFFERLARRVIPALNDLEGPGFVFRVDMRLRPNGDSGPIVCPIDMLEEYIYAQGRDWERFAWLKGRVVNACVFKTPEAFEADVRMIRSLVKPFVFRKYLDFGAISSLTSLHEMIRAETDRRELLRGREGVNVKLGRGGIREIEFITQTLQVIRGGRDGRLRGRETLKMLEMLSAEGAIEGEVARKLSEHYVFLRNVEHALQYVDDQQTQWLPREGGTLECAAALLGASPQALWAQIHEVRHFVSGIFDSIFQVNEKKAETEDDWPVGWFMKTSTARAALQEKLKSLGYDGSTVEELALRIGALVSGRRAGAITDEALLRLRSLTQFVVEKSPSWCREGEARVIRPEEALSRYLKLLEAISGRSTYVALLYQYPNAAVRVGRVLAASRWSTDYVVRHPIVLDELVDGRIHEMNDFTPVDWSGWSDRLHRAMLEAEGDAERQMNILRDMHHAAVFRLMIADLDGRFTVERLADHLSALADAVLEEVIELAWQSLPRRHADRPRFAAIGYGKLGGKELGYQSDLDLVFLYDDPDPDADTLYARLVRRMMNWLTVQTSSGKLFDVDLRLRPNGENGLAVCSFEMFSRYQRNVGGTGAWFWEHQALSRARFVAGDASLGRRFEAERESVLRMRRDPQSVRASVIEMRRKMLEGHANRTSQFDIKHDRGGMVDVEFTVQALVLMHSADHPELVNNFGNILLLEMCARAGLIPEALASRAVRAYRRYRLLQHEIRLSSGGTAPARVPPSMTETDRSAVLELWRTVFQTGGPERA